MASKSALPFLILSHLLLLSTAAVPEAVDVRTPPSSALSKALNKMN